jgi:hypothetical protein
VAPSQCGAAARHGQRDMDPKLLLQYEIYTKKKYVPINHSFVVLQLLSVINPLPNVPSPQLRASSGIDISSTTVALSVLC